MHVGIRDHQDVVPGRRQHVDQVADLAVDSVQGRIDDQGDIARGKPGLQAPTTAIAGIGGILHAEDDLPVG